MINENEINYGELEIDKENSAVSYNDKMHKYWTKSSREPCISVTTLIHQFTTFDEEFWSAYKALESLVPDAFINIKPALLNTKRFHLKYLDEVAVTEDEFNEARAEILQEWASKREASCMRGTAIHRLQELEHMAGNTKELQHLGLGGKFTPRLTNQICLGEQGVYPELLLSRVSEDRVLRIAGQADLVIIDGTDVYILDYKTNKEIKKASYFDRKTKKSQMMKYPLNNLQDTNFWHYSLQLSTYAWMIEKQFPGVTIKELILVHYDHDGGCTTYECEYLKNDVERMLTFYRKQIEYDEFKRIREKITF
jgi:ATP-dependent exoDNAse (exonuclease V) beta subunit